jgi:hypothetical protein
MIKVGNRYKVQSHSDVSDEFKGRLFTLVRIEDDDYVVLLDGEDDPYEIDKNDWSNLVEDIKSWHGNILLHRFI